MSLARAGGTMLAPALHARAGVAAEDGDSRTARRLFEEALDISSSSGDRRSVAKALHGLAQLARAEGDAKQAAVLNNEALQLHLEIANPPGIVIAVEAIGGLAAEAGRAEHAARLLGAATALRDEKGQARLPWESSRYERDMRLARDAALSERQFQAAFTAGSELSIEEAVALASNGRGQSGSPNGGWQSLTETEREVAALVAEGMTNREIAALLFVSPGTVKNHLSHVFSKLGIERRVELAQEVSRRGGHRPRSE